MMQSQENAIQTVNQNYAPALPVGQSAADSLLMIAIQRGASLDELEKLMALKERHEANEARKAYVEDMARAKANAPTITKNKEVSFTTQKGTTSYSHATLGNVVAMVVPWLGSHGFSHSWDTKQLEGGRVEVTCTLTHRLGHKESVTQSAGKDDSGTKNNIQAVSSAITYLERYTLLAITGLATDDQDDDGRSSSKPSTPAMSEEERDNWKADWVNAIENTKSAEELQDVYKQAIHAAGNDEDAKRAFIAARQERIKAAKKTKQEGEAQ